MERPAASLAPEQALNDIRGMMARSSRFLSLSGWSGVWAGTTALVAAVISHRMIQGDITAFQRYRDYRPSSWSGDPAEMLIYKLAALAVITFVVAFVGAYFFTWRKAKEQGERIWNSSSRRLMWEVMIPMIVGGAFCLAFVATGADQFIVPACLSFYGLALINGSKYTLGEIRWLGYCELLLGLISLVAPFGYGIIFMAAGFGVLHIFYGIIMWRKYDKKIAA